MREVVEAEDTVSAKALRRVCAWNAIFTVHCMAPGT